MRRGTLSIPCPRCETVALKVSQQRGEVLLHFPCYACEGHHFHYRDSHEFWGQNVQAIVCTEGQIPVGLWGRPAAVAARLESLEHDPLDLMAEKAMEGFFDNPEVMYQLLEALQTLNDDGALSCPCGRQGLRIDLFPDHLELTCPGCGRYRPIPAARERDLVVLDYLHELPRKAQEWLQRRQNT